MFAERCSTLPMFDSGEMTHYVNARGQTAEIECQRGYRFDDSEEVKVLTCTEDGLLDWPGYCRGKDITIRFNLTCSISELSSYTPIFPSS